MTSFLLSLFLLLRSSPHQTGGHALVEYALDQVLTNEQMGWRERDGGKDAKGGRGRKDNLNKMTAH